MNENNYNEWAQTVRLVLDSKGRLSFLTGAVAEPTTEDPRDKQWKSENSLIIVWLVSSMETGINLDEIRGRVLGKVPFPTLRETFAEIKREETQQGVIMGKTPRSYESEGSTLATRNLDEGRRSDKAPWCDHCKHEWHTRETCWKLKGKPPNWKKKSGHAFQARNSDQGQQPPPSQFRLTTEQLDKLYKLLEYPTP
ncbi:hypothetical protein KIW84_011915 [Lathyrus oleraceus]|uniref:Retrotransposon Copia-like N-terminal domain-containing protein n=1 Tax=Pisum sativum TaxID=3888 RepID=A0A9D5BGA7_PEA|nr:hypothetical protein KIW84_011915 [Pisum sativum]